MHAEEAKLLSFASEQYYFCTISSFQTGVTQNLTHTFEAVTPITLIKMPIATWTLTQLLIATQARYER